MGKSPPCGENEALQALQNAMQPLRRLVSFSVVLLPPAGGALAEGFHDRLREFQLFERTFEVQEVACQMLFSGEVNV